MNLMMSPADVQFPRLFYSNQDRAIGNGLALSKDPSGCITTPVTPILIPTNPRFLNPVAVRPSISFGLE